MKYHGYYEVLRKEITKMREWRLLSRFCSQRKPSGNGLQDRFLTIQVDANGDDKGRPVYTAVATDGKRLICIDNVEPLVNDEESAGIYRPLSIGSDKITLARVTDGERKPDLASLLAEEPCSEERYHTTPDKLDARETAYLIRTMKCTMDLKLIEPLYESGFMWEWRNPKNIIRKVLFTAKSHVRQLHYEYDEGRQREVVDAEYDKVYRAVVMPLNIEERK